MKYFSYMHLYNHPDCAIVIIFILRACCSLLYGNPLLPTCFMCSHHVLFPMDILRKIESKVGIPLSNKFAGRYIFAMERWIKGSDGEQERKICWKGNKRDRLLLCPPPKKTIYLPKIVLETHSFINANYAKNICCLKSGLNSM